jgi:DNA-binding response OmpR family regulator
MEGEREGPILVVSARWQTRALLAAELGERVERDVLSVADVNEALALIKLAGVEPALLVVDAGGQMGPEDVERLTEAQGGTGLVLVVSRLRGDAFDSLRERCADYLTRPVSIGAIADAVLRVLSRQGAGR